MSLYHPGPSQSPDGLLFGPPALNNPTTINIPETGGFAQFEQGQLILDDNTDYILRMPTTGPRTTFLGIWGGRNYRMIGGKFDMTGYGVTSGRVLLLSPTGHAFIEGLHMDVGGEKLDAFVSRFTGSTINGPSIGGDAARITFQNIYVENIFGEAAGNHGDFFQSQPPGGGGAQDFPELRVERATIWSRFNGVVSTDLLRHKFKDVEFHKTDDAVGLASPQIAITSSPTGGELLETRNTWIDAAMITRDTGGVDLLGYNPAQSFTGGGLLRYTFSRYLTSAELAGLVAANQTVEPNLNGTSSQSGQSITMDGFEHRGSISLGVPPGGSKVSGSAGIVDPANIGLNYTSPWGNP